MSGPLTVLAVGATGSIGRLVVEDALEHGHTVRALVRDTTRAAHLDDRAEIVVADLTDASSLVAAVDGIDAVVFTHGSHGEGPAVAERVDYGAVANVLTALQALPARIALMTAIGVTMHDGSYNRSTGIHDWKRRSERLVRASGNDYTIVRPGWFDYSAADEQQLVMLQGDRRRAGNASDGAIARSSIARVLVASLTSAAAARKTLELVAERGPLQADLGPVFAELDADTAGAVDAVHDLDNFPLAQEPPRVRAQLDAVRARTNSARPTEGEN